MATLALAAATGFLIMALLLFWLSRLIHPELLDEAVASAGFAALVLGGAQLGQLGLASGALTPLLLLAVR